MNNRKFTVGRLLEGILIGVSTLAVSSATSLASAQVAGGFLETPDTAIARPALSTSQIQSFLPQRGAFKFPAPYNTDAVRLTNATDCAGADCVNYVGYSYWRNMNNHVGQESMLIFLGLDRSRGGAGPTLMELNKSSGVLKNLGPLLPKEHPLSWSTGEGWYFSATLPTKLYLNDGPRIVRLDVITGQMQTVADVTQKLGSGYFLRQMHSSDDDRVHSATVRESTTYRNMGCMVYEEDIARYHFFPITTAFDECQVDRSGQWLVIKANLDGINGEDNLIVDLRTGAQRVLLDRDGAAGHSDLGHGYMIAADNWANDANTWKVWDFTQPTLTGKKIYHNTNWNVAAPDHVSHTNARPGLTADQQYACGSSINSSTGPHANEIFCFTLNGSESTLVVAPVMTNPGASGGDDEYARYAKGNLDVTGRYYIWTSNMGGSRLDAFIVKVPDQLLTGVSPPSEPLPDLPRPPPPPLAPPTLEPLALTVSNEVLPDALLWHTTRNVAVSSNRIIKTAGCEGCADAGAISTQRVDSGSATLEFTVQSTGPLMFAGFTKTQTIPTAKALMLGLRFQSGIAEVREKDVYRASIAFQKGDRFGIRIESGKVKYARNGVVFYTQSRAASYPLFAGTSHNNIGSTLEHLVLMTDKAPKITALSMREQAPGALEVSWTTDKPAESVVQYGASSNYGVSSNYNATLQTSHRVVLPSLSPGSQVHFRAIARDSSAQVTSSADMVVTTPSW
ncbi:MAG: fibronectin type III domain-containing protein [Gammaproteobacteria bacterium]|nr:fibronectin type III domain-containing protein [Gammaproteobacteria bacterium]